MQWVALNVSIPLLFQHDRLPMNSFRIYSLRHACSSCLHVDFTSHTVRPLECLAQVRNPQTLPSLALEFKAWLDAARVLFLLVAHLGVAAAFAHWSPRFTCLRQGKCSQPGGSIRRSDIMGLAPDDQAVCRLVILYILVISWILPILSRPNSQMLDSFF